MSTDIREINGSSADSDESRHNPLMMSTMSSRNNSITASSMYSPSIMTRSLPSQPTIEGSLAIREYEDSYTHTQFFYLLVDDMKKK